MKGMNKEARIEMASFAGKLGGKKSSDQNKAKSLFFFNKEWQKKHGYRNAGKRNVDSKWLTCLNKKLSLTQPNHHRREEASPSWNSWCFFFKARIIQQKKLKTGFYTEKSLVRIF